jgi:septum site-determining protein MinC
MSDCILIKGNKYGLTIILDENATFDLLKETLGKKISDAKKFFKNAKVAISFKGRVLSDKEQQELIHIITSSSDMEIICIMDDESDNKQISEEISKKDLMDVNDQMAIFHRGTLRSGQQLKVDHSIIIMGDVNPGAKVIAKGNVIILGSLKGTVDAKQYNNQYPFVVALSMNPMQLRIGNIMGRSPDNNYSLADQTQIAYVQDGRICIEALNKDIYKELENIDNLLVNQIN